MDTGRVIPIVSFPSEGEIEVTTEGIQFLQSLQEPLCVLCVSGPPRSGKSSLCNWLIGRPDGFEVGEPTRGINAWSCPLSILQKDERGAEREVQMLIMDSESFMDRPYGTHLLVLNCLLSSALVLVFTEPLSSVQFERLEGLSQLATSINIQKNQDPRSLLSNYLPATTWVLGGLELKQGEPASIVLERAFNKQPEAALANQIRAQIKQFFKKRHCCPLAPPTEGEFDIRELPEPSPTYKAHVTALCEHVRKNAEVKRILGKNISGGVLCNMLQAYIHRFSKNAPAVIIAAFERAVAAEARRNKEKLLKDYQDKMGLVEQEMPCDEDYIWKEHCDASKALLTEFDKLMMHIFDQEEVQEERASFVDRMSIHVEELKDFNNKQSEAKCREVFKAVFENVRKEGLAFAEDGSAMIGATEKQLLDAIQSYQDNARGPCMESIFAEEIAFLIPYMSTLCRQLQSHFEKELTTLQKEAKTLAKQKEEAAGGEKRLRELLEENSGNHDRMIEQRDKQLSDLQADVNTRIHQADSKLKAQAREIQGLKLELEQAQKEREMMIEAEKEINEKRISDLEAKLYRLQLENAKYERTIDELREEQEKQIVEKIEQINELSRKLKLMETNSDPSPRQDTSLLRSFKEYLDDIFNKFSKEEIANKKYLNQLERVSLLQTEYNELKLKEQENRNVLIDEYEEKIRLLKQEKDQENKQHNEMMEKQKEELKKTYDSITTDLDKQQRIYAERESQIKRLMEEKLELSNELTKREQQISDQYEVIDAYKKELEILQINVDDRDNLINRLKIENVEEKDDNDILVSIMEDVLKKRPTGSINISKIQNNDNRTKVAKILKRNGIPYS